MSLYNMVHGNNPGAPLVLNLLGKPQGYFGRLRDAWIEGQEDGTCRFAIYTRNGGGNREHYDDEKEAGPDCECTGCIATYRLPADPAYLSDRDDDFDCTYATFYFKVPEDAEAKVKAMAKEAGVDLPEGWKFTDLAVVAPDMQARWEAAIEAIRTADVPRKSGEGNG